MKNPVILTIIFSLPLIGAICSNILKEIAARTTAIIITSIMCIVSLITIFTIGDISLQLVPIDGNPSIATLLLLLNLSLLIFAISTDIQSKDIWSAFLACITITLGFLAETPMIFSAAWISSILLLTSLLKIPTPQSFFLIILSSIYLLVSALPAPISATADPPLLILNLLPLLLSCGIFPFHSWLQDGIERSPSSSGILFSLAALPLIGILKFVVPNLPIGIALWTFEFSVIISLLIILPIFFIKNDSSAFASTILATALALILLPPSLPKLGSILLVGGGVGVMAFAIGFEDKSRLKRWLFLGLPGGAVFPALIITIFALTGSHPIIAISIIISFFILSIRKITIKEETRSHAFSRLTLSRIILLIATLVIGLYPQPWIKLLSTDKNISLEEEAESELYLEVPLTFMNSNKDHRSNK